MNAIISSELTPEQLKEEIKKVPSMDGLELSSMVTTKEAYFVGDPNAPIKVAVLDLGIKKSIVDKPCQQRLLLQSISRENIL